MQILTYLGETNWNQVSERCRCESEVSCVCYTFVICYFCFPIHRCLRFLILEHLSKYLYHLMQWMCGKLIVWKGIQMILLADSNYLIHVIILKNNRAVKVNAWNNIIGCTYVNAWNNALVRMCMHECIHVHELVHIDACICSHHHLLLLYYMDYYNCIIAWELLCMWLAHCI